MKPNFAEKSRFKTAPKTTVKLTDLLKVEAKKEATGEASEVKAAPDKPFTPEDLQRVWLEFAELRKKFQAEYQLLCQPYDLNASQVTVHLHNPVQEMMLNNMRTELGAFLREKLQNNTITVVGEMRQVEERKVIYTAREKFDYLLARNPMLRELKDRLGLDTDF